MATEKDIVQVLQTRRLIHFGHVNRMHTERYHVLLYCHTHGHRPKGRPRKKWVDNIREDCAGMDIAVYEATCLTLDRRLWRNTVQHNYRLPTRGVIAIVATAISQVSRTQGLINDGQTYTSKNTHVKAEITRKTQISLTNMRDAYLRTAKLRLCSLNRNSEY